MKKDDNYDKQVKIEIKFMPWVPVVTPTPDPQLHPTSILLQELIGF